MTRVTRGDVSGSAPPDYGSMSLPELEAREREQREAFREAFGDLQGRLSDGGERVSTAATKAREILGRADDLVRRHHRVAIAASIGVGFAIGYSRPRVVAERSPSERDEEYVLVRRERRRPSAFRAAAKKLAGIAAAEALQVAAQVMSERRAAPPVPPVPDDTPAEREPEPEPEPVAGASSIRGPAM
jgi:ElaB/YqjD/DUF883 family membrane-anchored ribosome-binding protein